MACLDVILERRLNEKLSIELAYLVCIKAVQSDPVRIRVRSVQSGQVRPGSRTGFRGHRLTAPLSLVRRVHQCLRRVGRAETGVKKSGMPQVAGAPHDH